MKRMIRYGIPMFCGLLALIVLGLHLQDRERIRQTSPVDRSGSGIAHDARLSPRLLRRWSQPLSSELTVLHAAPGNRWIAGERNGRMTALEETGKVLWQVAYSNHHWTGFAALPESTDRIAVTEGGQVCRLDVATGTLRWHRALDGSFRHAPLFGTNGAGRVVWLVSQRDGKLFCLRTEDGMRVWETEPTNRCDGRPALMDDLLAYGNCDGTVYLFSTQTGASKGSIPVGENDQMAGAMLATSEGLLVTGTRQGMLVAIDPIGKRCVAKVTLGDGEAFATPVQTGDGRIVMGTPDNRISLWRMKGTSLVAEGAFSVPDRLEETVLADGEIWALVGSSVSRVDVSHQRLTSVSAGDRVEALTPGCAGQVAVLADGAVVCFQYRGGIP